MTVEMAREKAENYLRGTDLSIGSVLDDGEYFIFGYTKEVEVPPIGVNKDTGEVISYFPPAHGENFINATEL